ncbi:MAG: SGNH/GDSL hydrolase family protein [Planctomycetota bacterium]|jgi:lysophospholipase L1-like esterase
MAAEESSAKSVILVPKTIAKLEKGEQVTIVALGDSNTEQTFHTRGQMGWPYLLQTALFEKYGPNKVIMINAGHCGEGAARGLKRLDKNVLRFQPDLVIVCYWLGEMEAMREIIARCRKAGAEVLLRTPNPMVAVNMPSVKPPVKAGKKWPGKRKDGVVVNLLALAKELKVPVVDHYNLWLKADATHHGPGVTNPNKLWMRMSDVAHPGPLGHLAFYRELAPAFGLPTKLSWEF